MDPIVIGLLVALAAGVWEVGRAGILLVVYLGRRRVEVRLAEVRLAEVRPAEVREPDVRFHKIHSDWRAVTSPRLGERVSR